MRTAWLPRLLFILYCLEAGSLLLIAPWTVHWTRTLEALPATWLQSWLWQPWVRATISSFGVVHWVWAAYEVQVWWRSEHQSVPSTTDLRSRQDSQKAEEQL